MALDHVANFGDQRRHILALVPVAALWIKHRAQLLDQEGDIPPLAEYRRDDAGQRHDPLIVLQALGVDENLERTASFVNRALVENDVVDGDEQRVLGDMLRRLQLVGGAHQPLRAQHGFVHMHHVILRREIFLRLILGTHLVGDDFLVDLLDHNVVLRIYRNSLLSRRRRGWRPYAARHHIRSLRSP